MSETCEILLSTGHKLETSIDHGKTAKDVLVEIFEANNINPEDPSVDVLAIWAYTEPSQCREEELQLQLKNEHVILDVKKRMKQMIANLTNAPCKEICFKLARNGFYPISKEENIDEIGLLKFLYYEAKSKVHLNIYPLTDKEIDPIKLTSIEHLIEKQDESKDFYKTFKEVTKSLSYKNSIRKKLICKKMLQCAKSEKSRIDQERELDEKKLYQSYLAICRKVPCYGGFFFEGQMERSIVEAIFHLQYYDKTVKVAINERGLHIVNLDCPKIPMTIPLEELYYGILRPKKEDHHYCLFVKKSNSPNAKLKQIYTRQASFIDKILGQFIQNKMVSTVA